MNTSVQDPERNNPFRDFSSFCISPTYLLFLLRKVRHTILRSNENTDTSLCNKSCAEALHVAVAWIISLKTLSPVVCYRK